MRSARVIAPASIGNQKVPMSEKLRAVTDRTAKAVIQGVGFMLGYVVCLREVAFSDSLDELTENAEHGGSDDGKS